MLRRTLSGGRSAEEGGRSTGYDEASHSVVMAGPSLSSPHHAHPQHPRRHRHATYLAHVPGHATPSAAKPRLSSMSRTSSSPREPRTSLGATEVGSASAAGGTGLRMSRYSQEHTPSVPRRGPRRSAYDSFDEIGFCNDLASRIASELAAKSKKSGQHSRTRERDNDGGWRGSGGVPAQPGSPPYGQGRGHLVQTAPSSKHSLVRPSQEEAMTIETGHGDSGLLDGAAQDGDDVDEGAEDDELRPDRTEKTKAAAEAFLRRLAERQDPTSDEVEQGLEGQVFSLFGRQPANRYSTDDDIKNEGEDGHHDTGVASEVETKVTSMLREQPAEPARQGPMIEMLDGSQGLPIVSASNSSPSEEESDEDSDEDDSEGSDRGQSAVSDSESNEERDEIVESSSEQGLTPHEAEKQIAGHRNGSLFDNDAEESDGGALSERNGEDDDDYDNIGEEEKGDEGEEMHDTFDPSSLYNNVFSNSTPSWHRHEDEGARASKLQGQDGENELYDDEENESIEDRKREQSDAISISDSDESGGEQTSDPHLDEAPSMAEVAETRGTVLQEQSQPWVGGPDERAMAPTSEALESLLSAVLASHATNADLNDEAWSSASQSSIYPAPALSNLFDQAGEDHEYLNTSETAGKISSSHEHPQSEPQEHQDTSETYITAAVSNGEELVELKQSVENVEEDTEGLISGPRSLSPALPASARDSPWPVMTPGESDPPAHVNRASDLVNFKTAVLNAASAVSQPAAAISDAGTPNKAGFPAPVSTKMAQQRIPIQPDGTDEAFAQAPPRDDSTTWTPHALYNRQNSIDESSVAPRSDAPTAESNGALAAEHQDSAVRDSIEVPYDEALNASTETLQGAGTTREEIEVDVAADEGVATNDRQDQDYDDKMAIGEDTLPDPAAADFAFEHAATKRRNKTPIKGPGSPHPTATSSQRRTRPRHSDPKGDLADYVPEEPQSPLPPNRHRLRSASVVSGTGDGSEGRPDINQESEPADGSLFDSVAAEMPEPIKEEPEVTTPDTSQIKKIPRKQTRRNQRRKTDDDPGSVHQGKEAGMAKAEEPEALPQSEGGELGNVGDSPEQRRAESRKRHKREYDRRRKRQRRGETIGSQGDGDEPDQPLHAPDLTMAEDAWHSDHARAAVPEESLNDANGEKGDDPTVSPQQPAGTELAVVDGPNGGESQESAVSARSRRATRRRKQSVDAADTTSETAPDVQSSSPPPGKRKPQAKRGKASVPTSEAPVPRQRQHRLRGRNDRQEEEQDTSAEPSTDTQESAENGGAPGEKDKPSTAPTTGEKPRRSRRKAV